MPTDFPALDLPAELVAQVRDKLDAGLTASSEALTTLLASGVGRLSAAESSVLTPKDGDELGFYRSTNEALMGPDAPRVPTRASIAGYVYMTGQTVATGDASASARHNPEVAKFVDSETKEYLAAPIVRGEAVAGVLTFVNRSSVDLGAFDRDEIALAEKFAELCALVLDHIEKLRRQTEVTAEALRTRIETDRGGRQGFVLGSSGLVSEGVDLGMLRTQIESALDDLSEGDLELVRDIVDRLGGEGRSDELV